MPPDTAAVDERQALSGGAAALGLTLTEGQLGQLSAYLDLLERWNSTYNLTAVRERSQMRLQHLLDCIAAIPALRRQLPEGGRVLDVGSGGGLPGVVWAVLCSDLQVTCVDAVAKKAAFVRHVAASLALANLHAWHGRVQSHRAPGPGYDLITSRAFAALPDFTAWTAHLLRPGGVWLAMKGHRPEEELKQLPPAVEVFHVEPLDVPGLDAERCLIWMRPSS